MIKRICEKIIDRFRSKKEKVSCGNSRLIIKFIWFPKNLPVGIKPGYSTGCGSKRKFWIKTFVVQHRRKIFWWKDKFWVD